MPLVDRDSELTLVAGLVNRAGHRARPLLVTVLGEAGTGKTRFLAVHAALLASRCGIALDDSPAAVHAKLASALGDRLPDAGDLLELLLPLFDAVPARSSPAALDAWWRVVADLHRAAPLVVTVDDLHHTDDALLGAVSGLLAAPHPVPLCVVVGARPGLLERRPDWNGVPHGVTITLDPLTDEAVDRIFEQLVSEMDDELPTPLLDVLTYCTEQDPHDRRGYLRRLLRLNHFSRRGP